MVKYFISEVPNIALYNLDENECEIHTLNDGKTLFIVDTTEEKIAVWVEANENRVVEFSGWDGKSVQLDFTRARLVKKVRDNAAEAINALYPLYKQNNINELQGYTQADKDAMWIFINGQRDVSNTTEVHIAEAVSLKELQIIEEGM